MTQSDPVFIPAKATPVEPGEPQPDIAVSQLGGTFAERAKARAKAEKQIAKTSDDVEDKAIKKASTKRAAKKS